MFRQTLLCRAELAVDRTPRPAVLERLAFSTQAQPRGERGAGGVTFDGPTGSTLTTDHPLVIEALERAARAWPAALWVGELIEGAPQADRTALCDALLRCYAANLVTLHVQPPALTTTPGDAPRTGARAAAAGRRPGPGDHPDALPPQDRRPPRHGARRWSTCCSSGTTRRLAARRPAPSTSRRDGAPPSRLRDPADRPRGHGAAALHQRHHRHAEGRGARARGRGRPPRDRRGYALDLRPDDVFWCTADPGWVTGTSYGMIAPLTHGVTAVIDAGEFDARRWYRHPRRTSGSPSGTPRRRRCGC